jgi:hypothetical protein
MGFEIHQRRKKENMFHQYNFILFAFESFKPSLESIETQTRQIQMQRG